MNADRQNQTNSDNTDLTGSVIGAAMRISSGLGVGFLERVYENALVHELRKQGFEVEQQKMVSVHWDGVVVGQYTLDLLINTTLIVELKVTSGFTDVHVAQTLNYLRATDRTLALLLNFGTARLGVKRVIDDGR